MIPDLGYTGFSCPQAGLDAQLLEVVVAGHAIQLVREFLRVHEADLERHTPGLGPILERWSAGQSSFDAAWDPAFGDLHASLLSGDDTLRSVSALGLRVTWLGRTGEWRARLPEPARLRFGEWLLPSADELRVSATSGQVVIETSHKGQRASLVFAREEDHWLSAEAERLPLVTAPGFRFTLSSAEALSPAGARRLLTADAYDFDPDEAAGGGEWRPVCESALRLIRDAAPGYTEWAGTVLRELVPLQSRPGIFNSGSHRFSPGVICVSDQRYVWPLAEMLVHEATHQYLHIITRLGPLDDRTDQNLYYSPFRDKMRPIFFIVVAYHAFGNVALFYRTARANGHLPQGMPDSDVFRNREENLLRQLREIEPVLRNATSLTPLGQALWQPLYEHLHQEG
ncbi:aKG-HExxH-type peptide beta-hydroxylase [Sphaerisporangium sp. NPDC004334]